MTKSIAPKLALKITLKYVTLKNFVKLWPIYGISASISCFAFVSPKNWQILNYFALSGDSMIADFRNSVCKGLLTKI